MSIAVLIVCVILGLIVFLTGASQPERFRPLQFAVGTAIIVVGILAIAWVPAFERLVNLLWR